MTNNVKRHLLTLYTRTPLHVGSGTSVDVVDLPIMRERITGFPVIPNTSLKGVLRQWGRDACKPDGSKILTEEDIRTLFGEDRDLDEKKGIKAHAGCVQIMEAKILAFPVRSLAGCFAWITCPAVLERFQRDTERKFDLPCPAKDKLAVPGACALTIPGQARVVLEEYALATLPGDSAKAKSVADALGTLCLDPLWTESLGQRLAVLNDENFQHFVTTCTEVVARIKVSSQTRTVDSGALFNQENVPCEALFYSVLTVLPPRRNGLPATFDANDRLAKLLSTKPPPILQIGGDETTGHGFCEAKREELT
ncbi:MAG: type III-B CRISPR module RAMP protein Cmr4 [Verrucomicrobia bacterium]|nr:type III-B CRISPR module RAMP protein Cmr4 [Verrucomicrobiota bacterium]